jgi:hypothetical protein
MLITLIIVACCGAYILYLNDIERKLKDTSKLDEAVKRANALFKAK